MNPLEQAILLAVEAHQGATRKGGNLPYILHPLETAAICATMTDDIDVLAAAVLHDVVEDTAHTMTELEETFGPRIAGLVAAETENKRRNQDPAATWRLRKEETIRGLEGEGRLEVKMLALSDKLSNLRSLYQAYRRQGDQVWTWFHERDPEAHCWYYRQVGAALAALKGTSAWREYWSLYQRIWPAAPLPPQAETCGPENGRSHFPSEAIL